MQLPGAKPPADRGVAFIRMALAQPGFLQGERIRAEPIGHRELRLGIETSEDSHLLGIGVIGAGHDGVQATA